MKKNFNRFNQIFLNGNWQFITDENDMLSFNEAVKKIKNKNLPLMKIPSNWQLEGLNNFSGSVWFFKEISLPKNFSNNLSILQFNGVDYFADVWLNDNYLGHHEGYFQKFYFDVSDTIGVDNNLLVVKVTSPFEEPGKVWPYNKKLIKGIFNHHDCRPGGWNLEHGQDHNTGGIWNDIKLFSLNNIYIENVRITSAIKGKSLAYIKVAIDYYSNMSFPVKNELNIEITSADGKIIPKKYKADIKKGKHTLNFNLQIKNPQLWWTWDLGEPNLYSLKIFSEYFSHPEIKFGIKKVELTGKQEFFLNGKRLFLRGTNVIPTQFLSELNSDLPAETPAQTGKIQQQIQLVKEANINIIRVHAHVNRKEYYDECDRQGILVWQDFALQWTYDTSKQFAKNAASQIKDMVKVLYNHPSIAFWCCHNEPGEQIKTLDPLLRKSVMSIDKNRIVRLASNYEEHPYDGWYWGSKEHFAARHMGPLVTEFGAQALPEINSLKIFIPQRDINHPERESWEYHDFQYDQTFNIAGINRGKNLKEFIDNFQTYQAELIKTAIDFYRRGKNNDITGIFQFMFIDCWPSITWSVVDYYGKKKKGYYALKRAFQPLYVSISLLQKKYLKDKNLNLEIWIINDLHKSFKNCFVEFRIDDKSFYQMKIGDVEEDSIRQFRRETLMIKLPGELKIGKHNIFVELKNKNAVLSSNDFDIEIVKKK